MRKLLKKITTMLIISLTVISLVGCSSTDDTTSSDKTIRIVNKNYPEQRLLGQMLWIYLESKGYDVTVSELGGTMLCLNALRNDDADIYFEYTGTAYSAILNQSDILSADDTYDYVKEQYSEQYGITWFEPLGFNNTYVLSVTRDKADEYNLETISDLIPISQDFLIGSDSEFANRTDGYEGLLAAYPGLEFGGLKTMDQGLTYNAVKTGDLDVNVSYATDGRIAKYDLVNLEDDNNFFPPYYVAPIVNQSFLDANPDLSEYLEALANVLTTEDMQKYNLLVDEGTDVVDVATQLLQDKGLIE